MGTELKTTEVVVQSNGAPVDEAIHANGASPRKLRPWQRRRYQFAAGAVIALVLAAVIGDNVVARQYTPDGAVRDYFNALRAGNASAAWSEVQVATPTGQPVASLIGPTDMGAALKATRPDIKNFDITSVTYAGDASALVGVAVQTSGGTHQLHVPVIRSGDRRYGLFPIWKAVVTPVTLTIALPEYTGGVAIDGHPVDLKSGASQVAVLPIAHEVTFASTGLLAAKTTPVDAFFGGNQAVAYQPTFTTDGMAKVKSAVSSFFSSTCAQQTSPAASTSCPQLVKRYLQYSGHWQIVGDPAQAFSVVIEPKDQTIWATGHFQMVFGYAEDGVTGMIHDPDGSGYSARLVLTSSDVKIDHIARDDLASPVQRPARATDQAALALVTAAFTHCASVSAETVADCPQAAPDIIIDNVHWSLQGDPTAGATVAYDGATGLLDVHGNFAMGVTYTWFGQSRSRSSYITHYDAYLFWDGNALQLIAINEAES